MFTPFRLLNSVQNPFTWLKPCNISLCLKVCGFTKQIQPHFALQHRTAFSTGITFNSFKVWAFIDPIIEIAIEQHLVQICPGYLKLWAGWNLPHLYFISLLHTSYYFNAPEEPSLHKVLHDSERRALVATAKVVPVIEVVKKLV